MDYTKLSPALASAFDAYAARGREALTSQVRTLGLVSMGPSVKPARVVVFVHCDPAADLSGVYGPDVELNQADGAVRTGIVALDGLDRLTDDPAVTRVVPARRLRLLLDVAAAKVGVTTFRSASGLSGKGVVIGIVDSGIETSHPSFAGRILQVWDQTMHGAGVAEGAYGAELAGPMTDLSRDTNGHGTHVAGIAAGADATFTGIAPDAELVIVKSDLLTAHIADGVRYIFRVAADLGRPAVVNLSLGGHYDAHDGTDSLSAAIDAAVGPGRVVCIAAGNEGNDNIHAQADVRHGSSRTFACAIPQVAPGETPFVGVLNGWYDGGEELTVSVVSPSHDATPPQEVIIGANPVRTYELTDGTARLITPGPDPANGDHNFLVEIQPAPTTPSPSASPLSAPGTWRVKVRSSAPASKTTVRVDLWSGDERSAQLTGRTVRDSMKVGSPGASSAAITVGSYTTRDEWEDLFGNQHSSGLEIDDVSDFSSEGPRRDGVEKPDLVAPGAMIVAALSKHSGVAPAVIIDDRHRVNAGTSMACPFVAGLVALLLERDPTLDADAAKEALRAASTVPGASAGQWDPKWGHGLIAAGEL